MKQTLKKIFSSYIKTVGIKKFIFTIISGVFVSFIAIIEPLIFTEIIIRIEEFYKTGEFDFPSFINYIIFWGLFILFSILIQYLYDYFLRGKMVMKNYVDMSNLYTKKILDMNYGDYLGKKQGNLYKIFDRGCNDQERFLHSFFMDYLKGLSTIFFAIIILLYVDYKMALISLSMLPIMIFMGLFFVNKLGITQKELNTKWENVYGKIGNILTNFSLVKILVLEPLFIKNIDKKLGTLYSKQVILMKKWSIVVVYTAMFVMISRILVIGFGTYFIINGTLSFAILFLFFSYIGWIFFPLSFIFSNLKNTTEQLTSIQKLHEEFDNLKKEDIYKGKKILKVKGKIEYKGVKFHYDKSRSILDNINFIIKPGEKIALVGNTGAGKSTIINLLLRFWNLNKGEILLDGENINNISKKSLRKHIGVVTQDNSLFNASIKENLLYAKKGASSIDLMNAIKKAEADFVFGLKDGLDTIIGERGLKLSGGEKQRLSIARLFLRNPEILILDEATSALDNKTEKLVQKALDKLMKGRTSIIIAHRLTTIQHVDKIFVIENGKIIESGNYNELILKKGKFNELANPENLIFG